MKHSTRGGVRKGAGRPRGTGKYPAETTCPVRIPRGALAAVNDYLRGYRMQKGAARLPARAVALAPSEIFLPRILTRIPAGQALPAEDGLRDRCDLNRLMIAHPAHTYLFTVEGDSMNRAGIDENDQLVVDRKLEARDGDIVVAIILGEGHTVKRLHTQGPRPQLLPESSNPVHRPRELRPEDEWLIWGVVTGALKRFRTPRA